MNQVLVFYAIYDSAVGAYMRPYVMQSDGQALRTFIDEVAREDSEIGKHPEDYSLFRLGSFDVEKGTLHPQDPKCLARAHELAAGQEDLQKLRSVSNAS